jgi:cytochrome o ubiquinol oxidase subunit II
MTLRRSRPFASISPSVGASRLNRGVASLALLSLTSCQSDGFINPKGPIAAAQWLLMINATEIMLVVVVPVIVAIIGFAWWYRSSNARANHDPDWAYHGSVEFVTWSIPALVVILLGGVCWIASHQLDPRAPISAEAKPIQVDVVSLDWKWLFIYPDQRIAALNQLVIPAATPVRFRLTSATVMNSFFVPQLGSQIYAMAGMTTHLNLLADKPGDFRGLATNFNGEGFSDMRFIVTAVAAGDFDAWVGKVRSTGAALDDPAYAQLTKPSSAVPPTTYRSVDPTLFERIVDQTALNPDKARAGNAWCPPAAAGG